MDYLWIVHQISIKLASLSSNLVHISKKTIGNKRVTISKVIICKRAIHIYDIIWNNLDHQIMPSMITS